MTRPKPTFLCLLAAVSVIAWSLVGCQPSSNDKKTSNDEQTSTTHRQGNSPDQSSQRKMNPTIETPSHGKTVYPWISLFDGKTMGKWAVIRFTGNDQAAVNDGDITLEMGYPLAGIRFADDDDSLPKTDYELELQAKKIDGTDFFCCLTFPVNDEFCSLVLGGWGGTVSGISCINGDDASDNQTKTIQKYETDQWYSVRVHVSENHLGCWIDDQQIVDLPLNGIELSLRTEVTECKPLSLCSFSTSAAYRNIRIRRRSSGDEPSQANDK